MRGLTGLSPFWQVGSTESLPFFLKGFALVSCMCGCVGVWGVCVYRRKGCSFVAVTAPEGTTAYCGQQPSVRLNLETRTHEYFFKSTVF